MLLFILFLILAYLFGSISSAIIVCRLMGYPDPRTAGSKNPGATNVLRVAGKIPAIIALLGDALKGFAPVLIAKIGFGIHGMDLGWIALAAFLGHVYPIFFGFRGGKGVATYFGCLFALSWVLGLFAGCTWLIVALIFRYSSLASLCMVFITPFYLFWIADFQYFIPLAIIGLIVVIRHRQNIGRLLRQEETKIGKKG